MRLFSAFERFRRQFTARCIADKNDFDIVAHLCRKGNIHFNLSVGICLELRIMIFRKIFPAAGIFFSEVNLVAQAIGFACILCWLTT